MSYLYVPRTKVSQWRKPEQYLDASGVPDIELIEWCNDTISYWMRHFNVPDHLWSNGKVRWALAELPTKSPAAFATYWPNYIHLMMFDISWWRLMNWEQRREIFLHELAHVIDCMTEPPVAGWWARLRRWFDPTKGHGKRWVEIMKGMSLPPDRFLKCHFDDDKRDFKYSVFTGLNVNGSFAVANFRIDTLPEFSTMFLWIATGAFSGSVLGMILALVWRFM